MKDKNGNDIYIIYRYTSPNGKYYVGQTVKTVKERARKGGSEYKHCTYFWKAIQKHGWENFTVEVLCSAVGVDNANYMEKFFIALFDTMNMDKGYNLTDGGSTGKH